MFSNRAIPCDDLIGPGWTKFVTLRKDGSGRSDHFYLSPPGPDQVKKRSLTQAKLHHQEFIVDGTNVDVGIMDSGNVLPSSSQGSTMLSGTGYGSDEDEAMTSSSNQRKRKQRTQSKEQAFLYEDSASDSDDNVGVGNVGADTGGDELDDSDVDESVFESVYSCHPSKVRNASSCSMTYQRRCEEFYHENGVSELNPSSVDGILECLVRLFEVTDPNNVKLGTVDGLLRLVRKEMKKSSNKNTSGTSLTLSQKHTLNQLVGAYLGGKQYGVRTVRWQVTVLCALSKLLNRTIMVISPPVNGESSVGLLCINPSQYHDYRFHRGPEYFPKNDEEDIESDSESDDLNLGLTHQFNRALPASAMTKMDEQSLIMRAVVDFSSNTVIGYIAVSTSAVDYGLSDTDDDEEIDIADAIPTTATAARLRKEVQSNDVRHDPFVTPRPKKQKNDSINAVVPPITATTINPYKKQDMLSGKSTSLVAVGHGANDSGGINVSGEAKGGWGSSPHVLEQLNRKNTSSSGTRSKSRSQVVLELTHGITDRSTGEKVSIGCFTNIGNELWYFKALSFNAAFELYFAMGGPTPIEPAATCYKTWKDEFIRRSFHGENKYQRKGRIVNGQAPYPVSKPICEFRCHPSGFPLEVLLKKFESNFRSMCSDGSVLAAYLYNSLEESGSGMLNMFLDGKFKKGADKNVPYKSASELKGLFTKDIEETFKNGFARVEVKNHFDKHFCDFTIQQFLISLGYHSFDELKEEERSLIYKCGRFPEWDEITEEPISVSI